MTVAKNAAKLGKGISQLLTDAPHCKAPDLAVEAIAGAAQQHLGKQPVLTGDLCNDVAG